MLKAEDKFLIVGALTSLQHQSGLNVHIGGRSALDLLGQAHYLQVNMQNVALFKTSKEDLPLWFLSNKWDLEMTIYNNSMFCDNSIGLTNFTDEGMTMKISDSTRAIMECLSLCPDKFSLTEAYEIMENLMTLRPSIVQQLLERCKSIKVKRLFLYFAKKVGHTWLEDVDLSNIELGKGVRSIVSNGKYVSEYELILPNELL
jgi:hypothetical protein